MVARLARRLHLPFERIDIRPGDRSGNVASNARQDRYAALVAAARRHGADAVAVGHHALDRLETLLLSIARGRGLRGVATPRWRRSLAPGITLVRPLLDTTKEECIALCERFGVPVALDPGNLDPRKARGHLRRSILPGLLDRWPAILRNATRIADEAEIAVVALDRLAAERLPCQPDLAEPDAGSADERGQRWNRADCRAAGPTLVAWRLRTAAVELSPSLATAVPRITWERIARAACDASSTPRHFALGRLADVAVRARELRLDVRVARPSAPRST
jgi:tRNA(Ile)-lysidine synthetase-like protein